MTVRERLEVLDRAQEGGAFLDVWEIWKGDGNQPGCARAIKERVAEILGVPFEESGVGFSFWYGVIDFEFQEIGQP